MMQTAEVVEEKINDDDFDDEFSHYVHPDEPRPPKKAICGAKLRGVRADGERPICPECARIKSEEWMGKLYDIHGGGVMN